jgi:hypothetical protein
MPAALDGTPAFDETLLPDEQWEIYRAVIRTARTRKIQFALGGAFGFAAYTGQWRNTKDMDLYVLPEDRDAMVDVLSSAGLADFYGRLPYDRRWIYRGNQDDTIVDVIWAMANQRAQVDQRWFSAARPVRLREEALVVIPPEEMLWQKLYIVQRDRCDWPDVLNIIYALGPALDWAHLIERLEEDWPLLRGVLSVFAWIAPGRARALPEWLWDRLRATPPANGAPEIDRARVDLMDSRPWFQNSASEA